MTPTGEVTDWRFLAACARPGVDPEWFFPTERATVPHLACYMCRGCEVRAQCAEFAKTLGVTDGVWGGADLRPPDARRRVP